MLAIVSPGQGAQKTGFLTPWLDLPQVVEQLNRFSTIAGIDLIHYGSKADSFSIRETEIAQPLLVAASLIAAKQIFENIMRPNLVSAGHSVGELSAAAISGVFSFEAAIGLARERGRLMAQVGQENESGMLAVVGGDQEEILAKASSAGLVVANNNGIGQLVVAGTTAQLAAFKDDRPNRCRLVKLDVSGAFHTSHMQPAVAPFRAIASGLNIRNPKNTLLSNTDGKVVSDGVQYLNQLITQISNPVRWDLCMATMAELDVQAVLELPPAGSLIGIIKNNLPGVKTFALNTPDQLADTVRFIDAHTSAKDG